MTVSPTATCTAYSSNARSVSAQSDDGAGAGAGRARRRSSCCCRASPPPPPPNAQPMEDDPPGGASSRVDDRPICCDCCRVPALSYAPVDSPASPSARQLSSATRCVWWANVCGGGECAYVFCRGRQAWGGSAGASTL